MQIIFTASVRLALGILVQILSGNHAIFDGREVFWEKPCWPYFWAGSHFFTKIVCSRPVQLHVLDVSGDDTIIKRHKFARTVEFWAGRYRLAEICLEGKICVPEGDKVKPEESEWSVTTVSYVPSFSTRRDLPALVSGWETIVIREPEYKS